MAFNFRFLIISRVFWIEFRLFMFVKAQFFTSAEPIPGICPCALPGFVGMNPFELELLEAKPPPPGPKGVIGVDGFVCFKKFSKNRIGP